MSHLSDVKHDLKNEAKYVCDTLQETFDFSAQLLMYISKEIAAEGTGSLSAITKIVRRDIGQNEDLSWLNVGWADSKNMLVFDSVYGVVKLPYNLSQRPYIQECMKTPRKFYTSQVVTGSAIGIRIIPSGIGVANSKGEYMGTLCGGFRLADLNYRMQQKLDMTNFNNAIISYVVLDRDLQVVMKSPDNQIDIESFYYRDALGNSKAFINDEGVIATPVVYKDTVYTHYKKVKNFPYYVLTGTNKTAMRNDLFWKLCPFLLGFAFIKIICTFIIYINRRRLLKYANTSERAKSNFLGCLRNEIKTSLDSVRLNCEVIKKSLKREIDIGLTNEKQLELLDSMQETIFNLNSLTSNTLRFSSVEVNTVIRECILIHAHTALIRGVKIKTYLHLHIPALMADELRFKQIITGLIALSLEYSPKGKLIKILTTLKCVNDQSFLELVIQDNGFALDEEAIRRIHEKLEDKVNEGVNFEFSVIEKLIKMHGGTLQIESKWDSGKKIIVTFPYKKADQTTEPVKSEEIQEATDSSNVIYLLKR